MAQLPIRTTFKIPRSVLVVIHTQDLDVLLIERADSPGFWQSVTGSLDREDEAFEVAAAREAAEETGLDAKAAGNVLTDWRLENVYEIYPQWLHRYAPGVLLNTERVFGLCIPEAMPVALNPREHRSQLWLPWREAADRCFSSSNAEAVLHLPAFVSGMKKSKHKG
ncbi:dihydroneopterin triphosphate diphosphatase [Hydrogenophaga sp. RWCD_12]|uniref:dihydroneopterin triphosphate diphosphatase n=1 Tax=Hydrogenophaga sp. RWCD_12 TaxID=3391190 RepID=UPI00398533C3